MTPEKNSLKSMIYIVRGQKVMLDHDLANLYGVETKNLNRAVKRNIDRFPDDFMFQLTEIEEENLKCQIGTSSLGHGGRRKPTFAFTELGIAMLSSVLHSDEAIQVNISIMRTFFKLRDLLKSDESLRQQVSQLEKNTTALFKIVFERLERVEKTAPIFPPNRRKIGF